MVARLKAIQAWDRWRLRRLHARHPGLRVDPGASSNLAAARFDLAPGARLEIARGVVTERLAGRLHFSVAAGARVEIGEGTWLRTEIAEVHLVAFPGARVSIGVEAFLNGCQLSCKSELSLGRRAMVGPASRVYDADQHDLDADHPEVAQPVRIGECTWIASDVTVLRGVTIGAHSIVGTRSLVTRDIPPHTLAYGIPAQPRGAVGDRSECR